MQRMNFIIQDLNWTDARRCRILQARGAEEDDGDGSCSLSLITHNLRNRLIFPAGFALLIGEKIPPAKRRQSLAWQGGS